MDILKKQNKRKKFTLIEMLAVVGLIAVLAGIVLTILPMINRKNADTKTLSIIKMLEVALENYKAKYGYYLQERYVYAFYLDKVTVAKFKCENCSYSSAVKKEKCPDCDGNIETVTIKESEEAKNNFCQFIEYDSMITSAYRNSDGCYAVLDFYGNPILYRCPGYFNKGGYDIGSVGFNGNIGGEITTGTAKDAVKFEIKNLSKTSDMTGYTDYFGKGDDITNFKRGK